QIHSAPAGWSTLIRNLILAVIAGFVIWHPASSTAGADLGTWFTSLAVVQRVEVIVGVLIVALVAVEGWALFHMMTQQGRLVLRLEALETQLASGGIAPQSAGGTVSGLSVGTPAPAFSLSGLHGETLTLDALRANEKPV